MKADRPTPPADVMEQAAEWYWQISEPDVPAETIAAWQVWLRACEKNRAAFSSIQETLRQVDQAQAAPWPTERELLNDSYDGSVPITEWRAQRPACAMSRFGGRAPREQLAAVARYWAMAASVILLIAIGTITASLGIWRGSPTPPDFAVYATQAAEHRDVHLPDGSTITLGGKSVISTAYSSERRLIILEEGEAFFDVEKDADRPFVVQAGSRRILAVGTAFNVTHQVDRVVVTVTKGTVIVAPDAEKQFPPTIRNESKGSNEAGITRLEAGHRMAYSAWEVTPVTIADPADAIAWREGRLEYRGEALRYVLDDVNRYATRPIVLADDAAGRVSFTGTVFEQRIDSWLSGLEQVFPVEVEETPDGIIIRHKSKSNPKRGYVAPGFPLFIGSPSKAEK